jgi:hypothetical protein
MSFTQSTLKANGLLFISARGELFNHCDNDGPMWSGRDDRVFRLEVVFDAAFDAPPLVTIGLSGVDVAHEQNARLVIEAEAISEKGFEVVLRTWSDTRIGRASVNWMAVGPLGLADPEPAQIVPPRLRQRAQPTPEAPGARDRRSAG